jgi:gas vesicle protein
LLGIAIGAVLGLLFAPGAGEETREEVGRRLRGLRDLAGDKADELKELVERTADNEDDDAAARRSVRDDLERRLATARERRRRKKSPRASASEVSEEEDEPLA